MTTAGKTTHGLGRFCSSSSQRAVPGLAFFSVALVSTTDRRAFPLRLEHVVHPDGDHAVATPTAGAQANAAVPQRTPGRPTGSQTTSTADRPLSPDLQRIHRLVQALLGRIAGLCPRTSLLVDGHVGTRAALQMAQPCGLPVISQLRSAAAVDAPDAGPSQGRGPRRQDGANLHDAALPATDLQQTTVERALEPRI